jgi:phage/conjugal plasmid C-4 type zinc finger TraR family protein
MADIIDNANELTEHYNEQATSKRVDPLKPSGRTTCVDCDDPIGEARLIAYPAAIRCIDCQNLFK